MDSAPGQHGKAGTKKVNQSGLLWSKRWRGGHDISCTICKPFTPHSRQITVLAPHHSIFYRMVALP